MADLDDQMLVLRCQTGDPAAFEQLVTRYGIRLRYYVLKLTDRNDLDDLLQEIWLDVYRGLPKLREPQAFRAWLYRIARDRVYRLWRRTKEPVQPLSADEANAVATDEPDDFTVEDAQAVHQALNCLSTDHREVLVLRFIEDLSYEEIATITGNNLGTIKSRLHYAKRVLRQQIDQDMKKEFQ